MAHNLRPFRDYSEHEVLNLFAFSGAAESASVMLTKGGAVKLSAEGFTTGPSNSGIYKATEFLGDVGGTAFPFSNSQRFGVRPKVTIATSGDVLGLTLLDVRELDENGEKLIFNPRKAAEMNVVISGQAVPVLTRGVVYYSGTAIANALAGQVAVVSGAAGELANISASAQLARTTAANPEVVVGRFLGNAVNGAALLKIML
jgi:hypothetical protein